MAINGYYRVALFLWLINHAILLRNAYRIGGNVHDGASCGFEGTTTTRTLFINGDDENIIH